MAEDRKQPTQPSEAPSESPVSSESAARRIPRWRRPGRPKVFAVLPTLLTLGNAACGFGAITYAAKLGPEAIDEGNHILAASLLIFLAMVFDMLDGHAARLTKQTSEFGAQLDSLSDVISFGVAPAFLMLKTTDVYPPRVVWVIAVFYLVCAVLRLARFNVQTDEDDTHESFSGLPTPAAAGVVASLLFAVERVPHVDLALGMSRLGDWLVQANHFALPIITLVLAMLMVSRIRYAHVFSQLFRGRRSFRHLMQVILAIVAIYAARELAVPLVFCLFAIGSPLRAIWQRIAAMRRPDARSTE